jgi:hypothetical protein
VYVSARFGHVVGSRASHGYLLVERAFRCVSAHGVGVQFTAYGGELMRDAIRNDDHLAFTYLVFLGLRRFSAPNLVRRNLVRIVGLPQSSATSSVSKFDRTEETQQLLRGHLR